MSEYVHLIGAEQVNSAGHNMQNAAYEMNRAAANIDAAFQQHQRFLDDWLLRLQAIMEAKP